MGLSEDLRKVGETISAGEAKSLKLEGIKNEFIHEGEKVTYEIKIGKFGPYIQTSLADENGKALMRSIPPQMFPGTFSDEDALSLVFPPEEESEILFGRYALKKGRYGDYYERLSDGETVTWPKALKKSAKDATEEYIDMLFSLPRTIGFDKDNNAVTLKLGPYGFYAQYNGKNYKVNDPLTITIDQILEPKDAHLVKGEHNGEPIALQSGRYGLYIKYGSENIPLSSKDKKDPESLTLERLKEIVDAYKNGNDKKINAEREFSPVDDVVPLLINGNYGYYIKWGKENVALSKEEKDNPSSLTDERVKEIIAEYKAKPKTRKKGKFASRKKA